jgi:hypothetical protein
MEKKTAAKKTTTKKAAPRATKATRVASDRAATPKTAKAAKTATKAKARFGKSCKVSGCNRGYRAKGYCVAHYKQWRHGKFAKARYTKCHDYGCLKPMGQNRHGFCEEHFTNYYIKGMEVAHAPVPEAKPAKKEEAAESAA